MSVIEFTSLEQKVKKWFTVFYLFYWILCNPHYSVKKKWTSQFIRSTRLNHIDLDLWLPIFGQYRFFAAQFRLSIFSCELYQHQISIFYISVDKWANKTQPIFGFFFRSYGIYSYERIQMLFGSKCTIQNFNRFYLKIRNF